MLGRNKNCPICFHLSQTLRQKVPMISAELGIGSMISAKVKDQTFENIPVPEGTEKLTVVLYEGYLAILAVTSCGSIELEHPIFKEKIYGDETA